MMKQLAVLITKISKKLNGKYVDGLLVNSNGCHLVVEPGDMSVGRAHRFKGAYGEHELFKINRLVNNASTVAFIGTHIGSLAIPVAKLVKKAYLIEANPVTFEYLEMNLAINKIQNVETFNLAVGEKEAEINFVLNKLNSGGSKREPFNKDKIYYKDNPKTIKVPMVQFDSLVQDDEYFDLIFMDIEGSEYFALKGMSSVLNRTENLIIEFIGHHLKNVSKVTVSELVLLIRPYFQYLFIPSLGKTVEEFDFESTLIEMYENGMDDEGVIFSKSKIDFEKINENDKKS